MEKQEVETTENDQSDLAVKTLSGDLRDVMLTHVRSMETPWSKMSEKDQQEKIHAIENGCADIVRRAVRLISSRGFDKLDIIIADFTVKGGEIKGKFTSRVSENSVIALSDHQGEPAMIVLASASGFLGERAEAKPDPEQPELSVDEDGDGEAKTSDDDEAESVDTAGVAGSEAEMERA